MEFPAQAEVVIIGGGIVGVAAARELARAGVRDVVLIDRDDLGSGSTSKAAGGLRTMFSDETNIRLGARSLETYRRMGEDLGAEIDFANTGYLFLLSDSADVERFERDIALQNRLGFGARMLTVAEARTMCPLISTDGLRAAAFDPDGAHCTPEAAVAALAKDARRAGARLLTHTDATRIVTSDGTVEAVETSRGTIRASRVLCAAGVWSAAIAATAGVDLPITPLRRQIVVTEPVGFDARSMPFTIDFSTSFYFHSEGDGLLMGCPEAEDTREFDLSRDPAWLEHLASFVERRAPALADVEARSGWAGLYECTPDHNALIGGSADVRGLFYACGFSGHGFLQGPAVAEVMRDLMLGNDPFVDVSGLSAARFAGDDDTSLRRELTIV